VWLTRHLSGEWVEGILWDLIVTLDDASNKVYSGFFCEQEGVKQTIGNHGLFCSIYTDCGSHYWTTKRANEKVDTHNRTQFKRTMHQLGIEMITAYSHGARGHSKSVFGTLQQRST
jgi:hypothetical protein